ncbi:MAG: HD domain-containing protein [Lachnospiraceae bacterium]|nr:HD domain-containing protein [Lachnospiraceae bacterium]MBO6208884.1 HD domain-containing protein [Lachnospiraceae bacterium]MBP3297115.1 HD domain-containing protein [Lachnospiraceae bacterium]
MRYIKDLAEGNKIQGIYYCKSKVLTETKAGKPYENVILQDKTGILDSKVWEPYSPAIGEYEAGDYIEVTGDVITYNNALQAKLYRVRKCQEIEYDPADYMPVSKKDIWEMYEELLALADSVQDKNLKALLDSFFRDDKFAGDFRKASAAKTIHHGFIGGLLEHSLSVAKLCSSMCENYPILNRDLLITAALLHDVGKLREIAPFPENDYTDEGQLLGHIYMGALMVSEKAAGINGFPDELSRELQHCILAHHGELEYGSPKKPALIEALVLSFADNLDAKVETFIEQLENNDRKGWLGYCKLLDSNIRRT